MLTSRVKSRHRKAGQQTGSDQRFFKKKLVKIVLPEELQKVGNSLSSLADNCLEMINRAAEYTVPESTPIFIDVRNLDMQIKQALVNC